MDNQYLTPLSILLLSLYDWLCSAVFLNLNQVGLYVNLVEQERSLSISEA